MAIKKFARKGFFIALPLALLSIVGALFAFINRAKYSKQINAKEFIDIAIRSVEEADQLITLAERWTFWSNSSGVAALTFTAIAAFCYVLMRKQTGAAADVAANNDRVATDRASESANM